MIHRSQILSSPLRASIPLRRSARRAMRALALVAVLGSAFGAAQAQAQTVMAVDTTTNTTTSTSTSTSTSVTVWRPAVSAAPVWTNPDPTPAAFPMSMSPQRMTIPSHSAWHWAWDIQASAVVAHAPDCSSLDQTCLVYPQPPQP